jgi:hypothetical protein
MRLDPEESIIAAALDEAELGAASRRVPTHTATRSTDTGFRGVMCWYHRCLLLPRLLFCPMNFLSGSFCDTAVRALAVAPMITAWTRAP